MRALEQVIALFVVAVTLAAAARRVGAPYPVFLARGGAVLAFLPVEVSLSLPAEDSRGIRRAVRCWYALLVCALILGASGCGSPTAPSAIDGNERLFASHREIDVTFRSIDGAILAGTLMLPKESGRYPAIRTCLRGSDRA
jgi:hypothetical protein